MTDEKTPTQGKGPEAVPPIQPTPRPPTGVPASPWQGTPRAPREEPPEVEVDDILAQRSKRIRRLGAGGQGEVWLVEHLGQLEAHKFLTDVRGAEAAVFREALHTRKVRHPNIVSVYGTEEVGEGHVLRMEYVEGQDLATLVDREGILPVSDLVPIAIQVADALQATHERGILHHDLKPSNLILREDGTTVVVTDFGISEALRLKDGELKGGRGGTPHFMAPELFESDGHGSPRSDVWSLGVTLYYLLSLTYPFPFGEMSHAEAVRQEPHDLSRSHLYVPAEFWAILRRMLSVEADEGYASMKELKADLEAYLHSLRCPACGNTFRFESVSDACPDPACQSPRIAPFKRGLLRRRDAETALARCLLDDVRPSLQEAAAAFEEAEAKEDLEDVRHRLNGLDDDARALEELTSQARDQLERERFIDCVQTLQRARSRFSRSPEVVELRGRIRERLAAIHGNVERSVREHLEQQDFKAALAILTRIDHILGDKQSHRELQAALGEEPRGFRDLYSEVEQKELTFSRYEAKAREAILSFDFEKALRVYTALETEFPSEANVDMLARLRRAPSTYTYAIKYPEEGLRKVIADPAVLAEAKKIRIRKVNRACRKLLNDFSVEEYATFERIRVLKDLTNDAVEGVQGYVQDRLIEAKQAEEDQNVFEELQLIRSVEAHVLRSDLFDVATRQHVMRRLRMLDERVTKAEEHYKDGRSAMEAREYVKAQVAFREVAALIPDGYKDTEELREQVEQMRSTLGAMRQEVAYELGEITRRSFTLESATQALTRASELLSLSSETEQQGMTGRMASACTVLFDSQREHLVSSTEGSADSSFAFLASNFVPLISSLPEERWQAMLAATSDLSRAICGLLSIGYTGQGGPLRGIESEIDRAQAYCTLLGGTRGIVRGVTPPLGSHHPAQVVASALSQSFEHAKHMQKEIHLLATVAALKEVEQLAPPGVVTGIEEKIESLHAWGRRAALETWLRQGKRVALLVGPYAGVLVVGLVIGLLLGSSSAERRVTEELAKLAESVGFKDEAVRKEVQGFLGGERRKDEARVGFLSDWGKLRRKLSRPDEVTCTQWIGALEVARNHALLDNRPTLEEEFRKDLTRGGVWALRALFHEGVSALAATAGAGPGVRATVLERLAELQRGYATLAKPIGLAHDLGTLVDGLPRVLDGLDLAEDVEREVLAEAATRHREEFESLKVSCPNLRDAHPELIRWLTSELRDALVRELAERARQASRRISEDERKRFEKATDAILSACQELTRLGLPALVRPEGGLEEWSWRDTATEAVAVSLPEESG